MVSFKGSHAQGGLSYLLRAAKASAISFETHRACILTLSNAQDWPVMRELLASKS